MANIEICVICGEPVPEGRQICRGCEVSAQENNIELYGVVSVGYIKQQEVCKYKKRRAIIFREDNSGTHVYSYLHNKWVHIDGSIPLVELVKIAGE